MTAVVHSPATDATAPNELAQPRALPIVESPLRQDVYLEAADLYRQGRRAGVTVRSSVDCLIAACAVHHGLTVLHHERDFEALTLVSPLQSRELLP